MSVNGKLPGIGSYERIVMGKRRGSRGERRKVKEAGLEEEERTGKGERQYGSKGDHAMAREV